MPLLPASPRTVTGGVARGTPPRRPTRLADAVRRAPAARIDEYSTDGRRHDTRQALHDAAHQRRATLG
ncbi:MAG: hypothetical protein PVF43_17020, partial [Candidatus Eiseniibacteriota bacterium]